MKVLRKVVLFFIGGFLLTPLLFSKVNFDVVDSKLWSKSLKEACKLLNKGPLLVEKLSLNEWRGQKNVEFIIDDISVNKDIKNMVPSSNG